MKERLKKVTLIMVGLIIRITIVPFSSEKSDYFTLLKPITNSLLSGDLLYKSANWNESPIFAFISTFMSLINPFQATAAEYIFLSIPLILADIAIFILIYYFCVNIFQFSTNNSLIISALYYLNPRIIAEVYVGHFDNLVILFILSSIFLIFKAKDLEVEKNKITLFFLSGVILAIACLTKLYAIIAIPIIFLLLIKTEKVKNAVMYLLSCVVTITLAFTPFLIIDASAFGANLALNQFFSGLEETTIWHILSVNLPKLSINFFSDITLSIISYSLTGVICSFVLGITIFKKEPITKAQFLKIIGMFVIGFGAFFTMNIMVFYGLFLTLLIPVIIKKSVEYSRIDRYYKIMMLQVFLFVVISIVDLVFVISTMEKVNPINSGTNSYLGAIAIAIYFVACVLIYWLEILDLVKSNELVKITQFVIVGLSGTLITWSTLYAFVDGAGLPEWFSYFLAYSLGIINNFFWNRLWTFKAESKRIKIELFKYVIANFIGLSGYWIVASILTYAIGLHYFISNIIGTGASFTINYLLTRFWTFNYQFYYKLTPISDEKKPFSCILPMYNEEKIARESATKTITYLRKNYDEFEVIIAEHGAEDKTPEIARKLAKEFPEITHIHIDEVLGRGESVSNAIRKAKYDIVMFMDADLAVELDAIKIGIGKVIAGVDLVYGDRYHPESETERPFIREIISRGYNNYLRLLFRDKVADHQCGFKIFNRPAILPILDQMEDFNWFWDSEILIRSKKAGLKLEPIPVIWNENRDFSESKVNIFKDIREMGSAAIKLKQSLHREKKSAKSETKKSTT